MPVRYNLKLSSDADQDLSLIYEYGFKTWGEDRADNYYDALIEHFDHLCENPFLYAAIDEIRIGYRRSVCGSHSIYYRIADYTVEVMAVISRQNLEDRL